MGRWRDEDYDKYEIHPASKRFPEMSADNFRGFLATVAQAGRILLPIIVYGHWIIDGRHRMKAARKLGLVPPIQEFEPFADDPLDIEREIYQLVWALNGGGRRDLELIDKVRIGREWVSKGFLPADTPIQEVASGKKPTRTEKKEAIARQLGVGRRSLERDEYVKKNAIPAVQELLEGKAIKLRAADKLAHETHEVQAAAVAKVKAGADVGEAIKEARAEEKARKTPPVLDQIGGKVPQQLREVFDADDIKEFGAIGRLFDEAQRRILELKERPAAVKTQWGKIQQDLRNAKTSLLEYVPFAVCLFCRGTGAADKCTKCKGLGWLYKDQWDRLPDELKKAAG